MSNEEPKLRVSEIFYSLQGEGARAGEASIFIRLQGCSAKHACYASGVLCDTEFESGKEMTLVEIEKSVDLVELRALRVEQDLRPWKPYCRWIIFTGGEPLDQLNVGILSWFCGKGYKIAIETSGIKLLSEEISTTIEHIVVSPKVAEHVLLKNFGHLQINPDYPGSHDEPWNVDELRYVRHAGQPGVPKPALTAQHYYLSPHSDGAEINQENLQHCIKLCLENPKWRLSVQQHKIWRVL